ncbi:MAG: hypothetical protein ACFFDW_14150 [Candidatus Thorarchaeota archaeon]
MGYEMTRPAQKWIGVGSIFGAFFMILFTLAVPYVNHFGDEDHKFSYFTKWSGRWRSDNLPPNTYEGGDTLLNFPKSAPILIGIGVLVVVIGAIYIFWLTYSNKPCYITRERPGPVGGIILFVGIILYFAGNLVYEKWAYGSPRPTVGWPGDPDFIANTVRISPTYWIGLVIAFIMMAFSVMTVVYFLDTREKRPVK